MHYMISKCIGKYLSLNPHLKKVLTCPCIFTDMVDIITSSSLNYFINTMCTINYTQVPDISLNTKNVVISCSGLAAHGIHL
jgi:hypothetical protein